MPQSFRRLPVAAAFIAVATAGACAGARRSAPGGRGETPVAELSSHTRTILTGREVATRPTLRSGTALDVISALRPEFLRTAVVESGMVRPATPLVLVNGAPRGGIESLRGIPAVLIVEIRFVRPSNAVRRYGREYGAGAIDVTTTH